MIPHSVVSGWQQHTVSSVKEPSKNFVAMNREGVKNGCIDSKVRMMLDSKSPIFEKIMRSGVRLKRARSTMEYQFLAKNSPMESLTGTVFLR